MDNAAENPEAVQGEEQASDATAGDMDYAKTYRHIADAFDLRDEGLRDGQSGRWSEPRIADALGVSRDELTQMLDLSDSSILETPDAAEVQERLAPFANTLAMVLDYYGGDEGRTRAWFTQPQARLGNRSPLDALRIPGRPLLIEQWIAGLWLGDGE